MIFYKARISLVDSFATQTITMKSIYMLLVMLQIAGMAGAQALKNETMEKNKEVVRKIYEEALNKRNMGLLKEYVSPEYTGPQGVKGAQGFEIPVNSVINGFKDVQWNIQELIADGDKVMVKWKLQGTHTGQFTNYTPTGKAINSEGLGIYQFKDGKVVAAQVHTDRLGFLQQLGVLPQEFTSPAERIRFIDKFIVPAKAKQAFLERVAINRAFIKKIPGFIEDGAYENTDEQGNLLFITIAVWENEEALKKAKEIMLAEYQRQGFDMPKMLKELNITLDRGIYKAAK